MPGAAERPGRGRPHEDDDEPRRHEDVVSRRPSQPAGFGCPCHGGQYDTEGNRTAGPPVRALDRYTYSIVNGHLVLGSAYSVAKVEGTGQDAMIKKYQLHNPGQHVDGREFWLWPIPEIRALMATSPSRRKQMEAVVLYPLDWLEERSGLVGGVKYFLFRKVPGDANWAHTLGSATLTAFLVQAITGVILAMFYKPDPEHAYSSIQHITNDVTFGWLVRGMHRWGASVFIILLFFHMARVFLYGAYKYPRELNWIIGVILLILGMFEGFTGYLLPFDQTAYWATVVGMNITANGPFVGTFIGADPPGRARHRVGHARTVLLAAYARRARVDLRADRAAPVPRRSASASPRRRGRRRQPAPSTPSRSRAGRALRTRRADAQRTADAVSCSS